MRHILSIDGGGIRGIYPATILASIEEQIDEPIYRYFDLIAGTSTGGIIALGLSLGFSAQEICDFYFQYCPKIFRGWKLLRRLRHWRRNKYDQKPLEAALKKTFGDLRIDDCKTRVLVPSMDFQTGKV